jgi:hypothetical protein
VKGNIGSRRQSQSADDWSVGYMWYDQLADPGFRALTPWPAAPVDTAVMSAEVANCILSGVGATAPARDSVDKRVIADFAAGTGKLLDNVAYPADYPVFLTAAPEADADNDGMADSWERGAGLDPAKDDAASDKDGDGYTNVEEYLHYLSAKSYAFNPLCMPNISQSSARPAPPKNLRLQP